MALSVLLLLAAALCVCSAQGSENQASDCCLSHKNHLIPLRLLSSYKIQGPETGCRLAAVVFITRKNKNLCAPPTAQWVRDWMQKLDGKKPQPPAGHARKEKRPKGAKHGKSRKRQA